MSKKKKEVQKSKVEMTSVSSKIVPKILRHRVQDTTSGFGIFTPSIPPFHCYLLIDIFYVDVIPTAHVG